MLERFWLDESSVVSFFAGHKMLVKAVSALARTAARRSLHAHTHVHMPKPSANLLFCPVPAFESLSARAEATAFLEDSSWKSTKSNTTTEL